jgi:tryptophan 6-halogenase
MNNITILGGGSAGWMTAAYLSHNHPELNITLIESSNIPTVGVGEATTPYLMRFFKSIGIENESDWMPYCNATYKNGVMYEDWDFINSRWWHSFEVDEHKYPYWNELRREKGLDRQDYWHSTMFNGSIAIRDSAKWMANKDGKVAVPYYHTRAFNGWPQHHAHHIDAGLFGEFLKKRCVDNINYVDAEVLDIAQDENGIKELITERGKFEADLFIDCSGFKKILIDKVKEENFKSFKPYLTHDKAVVIRHEYKDPEMEMKPRTRSKCLSSGWYWDIPLYDRISNGYVYTSDFITDDEAERELRQDIGFDRTKDSNSFVVDIDAGYYPKPWSKNVVAVGLSAGFIEPLESTLLFVVQLAGIRIAEVIAGKTTVEKYNKDSVSNLDDYLDYISLGYYLSHRNDSEFWRSKGENAFITDRMKDWLDRCKYEMQPPEKHILFVDSSWISKLIGHGYYPEEKFDYRDVDMETVKMQMEEVKNFDYNSLISQKEYLDKFVYIK